MKWSLNELQRYQDEPLQLDSTLDLSALLTERFPEDILAVKPVKISGYLSYDKGDVMVTLKVETTITVPSSRSLRPVDLPLSFKYTEFYLGDAEHVKKYEDSDTVIVLDDDKMIDLDEAVAENIVLQIPMQVLSKEEQQSNEFPAGNGWEVISEEEYVANETESKKVDPRLAKLKELFPDQDSNNDD
ncbi:YceD family protein [Paucilactobacillus suebicus]|nr:YceD family protein [Paucilactobacillus suebicus]